MKKTLIYITTAAALLASASTFAYAAKDGNGERRGPHHRGPNIERMLEKLDANGDGGISLDEVKAAQTDLFNSVDTNSDNALSEEEFEMIKEIRKAEREANRPQGNDVAQRDGSGPQGQGPDGKGPQGKEFAEKDDRGGKHKRGGKRGPGGRGGHGGPGFERLDADNSGTVTLEEFTAHADKMFERFDRNSDGVINADDQKKKDDA